MPKIDLQKRIDELKHKGVKAFAQYKSSRTVLYRTFAEGYMLWRECEKTAGFLDREYKKAKIGYNKFSDNRVNFIPFVKLIFGLKSVTGADKNKVSHWASVFRALDDDYCERPQYYATKPASKLIDFIEQSGGVTEIVKKDADPQKDDDDDLGYKTPSKKEIAEIAAAVARRRMEQLVSDAPNAFAVADKFAKRISVDQNGLVAFIGKRNAKGKIELVATTINPVALQSVAVSSMRDYAEDVDPSLRTLVELIHTQTFPQLGKPTNKEQEKIWRRVVETHTTAVSKYVDVKDKNTGKTKKELTKLTNPRRVLILGDRNLIIYGRMREQAATVTIMRPKLKLVGKQIVMMNVKERRAFEEPIVDGSMAIYRATPPDKLQPVTGQTGCDFHLKLENTATKKTTTVRFEIYKDVLGKSATNFQLIFNADNAYKPAWHFTVQQEWFQQLRAEWLDRWFETLGYDTRILRSDSRVFELKVQPKKLNIRFEIDDDRYADKHSAAVPKVTIIGNKAQASLVASLDLAPVLFNLSEIAVSGPITVSGNANAVVFSYSTDMGEFTVALPTAKRVKKTFIFQKEHFSKVH